MKNRAGGETLWIYPTLLSPSTPVVRRSPVRPTMCEWGLSSLQPPLHGVLSLLRLGFSGGNSENEKRVLSRRTQEPGTLLPGGPVPTKSLVQRSILSLSPALSFLQQSHIPHARRVRAVQDLVHAGAEAWLLRGQVSEVFETPLAQHGHENLFEEVWAATEVVARQPRRQRVLIFSLCGREEAGRARMEWGARAKRTRS